MLGIAGGVGFVGGVRVGVWDDIDDRIGGGDGCVFKLLL